MVQFQKRVKIPQQKWYNFRKVSKILNKNGTISEKGQNSSTKIVSFQSEKGQKSSIKWYHFRKGSKILDKKWYHFSQKRVKIPRQNMYHFRKGSKFLSKISEEGQTSSTKMVPFQKGSKIVNENGTILVRKGSKFLNKNGGEGCYPKKPYPSLTYYRVGVGFFWFFLGFINFS